MLVDEFGAAGTEVVVGVHVGKADEGGAVVSEAGSQIRRT